MPALEKDGSGFLEDWQRRDDFLVELLRFCVRFVYVWI